jgi:hypothetical protein
MLQGFEWERLPPEIREGILKALLVADGQKIILRQGKTDPLSLSILRVSKQMYNEAYKVFYGGNTFHFTDIPSAMDNLPKFQSYVKAISFSVDDKNIEPFLALVERCRNLTSLYIKIIERVPGKYQPTHRQFPKFQHPLPLLQNVSVEINRLKIACTVSEYDEFKEHLEAMFLNCFGGSTATSSS